jgi:hypothetical protein
VILTISRLASFVVVLAAVISIPAILLLLVIFYETLFAPPVIIYTNVPFPVETPVVHPGDAVTFIVGRCANDPLSSDPVTYTFTRDLVRTDADPQVRTGIPNGSSDVPHGCEPSFHSSLNIIPTNIPSGRYFLEGTSTAVGKFKVTVAKWHSQEFEIVNDAR